MKLGFYNGMNVSDSRYCIGVSTSVDGERFSRSLRALLVPRPGMFDSDGLNGPCPVRVGEQIYIYYAGFNGTAYNGIGVAVLNPDLTVACRPRWPLLSLTGAGWESSKIFRPFVIYDPDDADAGRRFKMYYTGAGADGKNFSGVAFSADGITNWTRFTGNPVLSPSASGWDSQWAMAEHVSKICDKWVMLYNGFDGNAIQTGYATSSDCLGPWEKGDSNPIVSRRPSNTKQVLLAGIVKGSNVVNAPNTAAFQIGEPIFITSASGVELLRVKSIASPTMMTTTEGTMMIHPSPVRVDSALSGSCGPNQLEFDGSTYRVYGSAWNATPNYEVSTLAEGPSLDCLEWRMDVIPVMNFSTLPSSDWDSRSQENLKFIEQSANI